MRYKMNNFPGHIISVHHFSSNFGIMWTYIYVYEPELNELCFTLQFVSYLHAILSGNVSVQ
jgi:hypothetical protein